MTLPIRTPGGPLERGTAEDVERLGLELEEGPVKSELDGFVPEICRAFRLKLYIMSMEL